jgi:NCS1 family nucleobase:cation symporter-1
VAIWRRDPLAAWRAAVLPVMLGMGAPVPLLSFIRLAGVLVRRPPIQPVAAHGRRRSAIVALVFVGQPISAAITGIYSSAIGLHHFPALERTP